MEQMASGAASEIAAVEGIDGIYADAPKVQEGMHSEWEPIGRKSQFAACLKLAAAVAAILILAVVAARSVGKALRPTVYPAIARPLPPRESIFEPGGDPEEEADADKAARGQDELPRVLDPKRYGIGVEGDLPIDQVESQGQADDAADAVPHKRVSGDTEGPSPSDQVEGQGEGQGDDAVPAADSDPAKPDGGALEEPVSHGQGTTDDSDPSKDQSDPTSEPPTGDEASGEAEMGLPSVETAKEDSAEAEEPSHSLGYVPATSLDDPVRILRHCAPSTQGHVAAK